MKTKRPTKRKRTPYITINFTGDYKNFEDFFNDNKTEIYYAIVKIFKELNNSKKRQLILLVKTIINNPPFTIIEWNTEFTIKKNQPNILIDEILHHFENIEEYEKCGEVKELYKNLSS